MESILDQVNYFYVFASVLMLVIVSMGLYTVQQKTAVIVERFGGFESVNLSGLKFKIPIVDRIAGRINLKVQQLEVPVETITKDKVSIVVKVSVQYQVLQDKIKEAFYDLNDPTGQIASYVFDIVRSQIPKLTLDEVFDDKDTIAGAIKGFLSEEMDDYGYNIIKSLVTDADPDELVKESMNKINAAERDMVAAKHEAAALKIRMIGEAEAESESKRLQGEGTANQRRAIAEGLKDSVEMLKGVGIQPLEANNLLIATQHYDAMMAVGKSDNSKVLFMPVTPSKENNILEEMVIASNS